MFYLQNRWKLENDRLRYYGLRNRGEMFRNTLKLRKTQIEIVKKLPAELTDAERNAVKKLLGTAIVAEGERKTTPASLREARFCRSCAANDYMIPGLEFDENGDCPMCQTKEETRRLKSVVPVKNEFPKSRKSRFDVAVFYTGGKDSAYLLYYLSKVLKLRVLAMTWEIPYMSDSAKQSIENAKTRFDSVEFIVRKVANDALKKIYRRLYRLGGNVCACPSLAYVLFYPELLANRVPYFVAGNEPAQMLGLYYNHLAPKIAYRFGSSRVLNALIDLWRILTLRPPLKTGQFHTLQTMKQLAYGDNPLKNWFGYPNPQVRDVVEAIYEVPEIVAPLKRAVRRSSRTGNIPAFVQVDFNEICGGVYDWKKIKKLLTEECGWVPPDEGAKALHTSCRIERCKEYSQFKRFRDMESTLIPFSALEISLASRDGNLTKEEAVGELETALGFSRTEVPECAVMRAYFEP